MRRITGFLVLGMFAASFAVADGHSDYTSGYSEVRDLTLDADGLDGLSIEAGAGSLEVTGVEGADHIQVTALIQLEERNEARAREIIEERVELTLDRRGSSGELVAKFDGGWWNNSGGGISLTVQIPRGFALYVEDSSGSMKILDTGGDVAIDDGSGSIVVERVAAVIIDDGSGSIDIRDAAGDVRIVDGSGSIKVRGVAGSVTVDDGSGSINVSDVDHDVIIEDDGSGSLNVSDVRGRVESDG